MSKADELAKRLEARHDSLYGKDAVPSALTEAAAHLRALGASHQRLKEALEAIKAKAGRPDLVYLIAKLALEQAKDLS